MKIFNIKNLHLLKTISLAEIRTLIWLALGNILVSGGELFLFLLLQPFLGVFFSSKYSSVAPIEIRDLLPDNLQKWFQFSWQISSQQLQLYIVWGIVLAGLTRAVGTYLFNYYLQVFMLKVTEVLRKGLIKNVLRAPYLQIQKLAANEWMSRVLNDTRFLQMRGAEVLASFLRDSSRIFIVLVYLIGQNWRMTILIAAISPPLAWLMGRAGRLMSGYAEQFQRMLARMAQLLLEMRSRFEFIKAQKGEGFEVKRFAEYNEGYFKYMRRSLPIRSLFAPMIEWTGVMLICALVLMGFVSSEAGMSGRGFIAYFAVLAAGLKSIKNLAESITKYGETKGAVQEVVSFSEEMGKVSETMPKILLSEKVEILPSEIMIERVSVELGQAVVFAGQGVRLQRGRMVAIIGESGGGKSSFLRCLAGLIPPSHWQASVSWDQLVAASNFVSQVPFLFAGPLRENLFYGLEPAAMPVNSDAAEDILRALDLAEFIPLLADGDISRDKVSGGQLQRLTIARALLRQKSLLLFDEVTSALDLSTEERVVRVLQKIVREKNLFCFFVTHRHHVLPIFDEVWQVDGGKIMR